MTKARKLSTIVPTTAATAATPININTDGNIPKISPTVIWQNEHRPPHNDKACQYLFFTSLFLFTTLCVTILSLVPSPYQSREAMQQCCHDLLSEGDTALLPWGFCTEIMSKETMEEVALGHRLLSSSPPTPFPTLTPSSSPKGNNTASIVTKSQPLLKPLPRTATNAANSSTQFNGTESVFDVFAKNPALAPGLSLLVFLLSALWLLFLRHATQFTILATVIAETLLLTAVLSLLVGPIIAWILAVSFACVTWNKFRGDLTLARDILSRACGVAFRDRGRLLIAGLTAVKVVYWCVAAFFVTVLTFSFFVTEARGVRYPTTRFGGEDDGGYHAYEGYCVHHHPSYVLILDQVVCVIFVWISLFFDHVRLNVVATVLGWGYFCNNASPTQNHDDDRDNGRHQHPIINKVIKTSTTKSLGTLAKSSFLISIAELLNTQRKTFAFYSMLWCLVDPGLFCLVPLLYVPSCCIAGMVAETYLQLYTRFVVVGHAFTGLSLRDAALATSSLLKRHFVGGVVTDVVGRAVLKKGGVVLSFSVAALAWTWINDTYIAADGTTTGFESNYIEFVWLVALLLLLNYPLVGLFVVVMVNAAWEREQSLSYERGENVPRPETWVPPLAACFVGCVAMLFFRFVGGMVSDAVDVLFFCFALERDTGFSVKAELVNEEGLGRGMRNNDPGSLRDVIWGAEGVLPGCVVVARTVERVDPEIPFGRVLALQEVEEERTDTDRHVGLNAQDVALDTVGTSGKIYDT